MLTPTTRRLSFLRSFRFLLRFARRDLFEKRAWRTSAVCILTIALLTGLALVVLALPLVAEQLRRKELKNTSGALSLWVRGVRNLKPVDLAKLRESIQGRLANPDDLVGCFPFAEL